MKKKKNGFSIFLQVSNTWRKHLSFFSGFQFIYKCQTLGANTCLFNFFLQVSDTWRFFSVPFIRHLSFFLDFNLHTHTQVLDTWRFFLVPFKHLSFFLDFNLHAQVSDTWRFFLSHLDTWSFFCPVYICISVHICIYIYCLPLEPQLELYILHICIYVYIYVIYM